MTIVICATLCYTIIVPRERTRKWLNRDCMSKNLEARRGVVSISVSRSTLICCNYALEPYNWIRRDCYVLEWFPKLSYGCEVIRPPKRGCHPQGPNLRVLNRARAQGIATPALFRPGAHQIAQKKLKILKLICIIWLLQSMRPLCYTIIVPREREQKAPKVLTLVIGQRWVLCSSLTKKN